MISCGHFYDFWTSTHACECHQSLKPSYTATLDEIVRVSDEGYGKQGSGKGTKGQGGYVVVDADECLPIRQRSGFRVVRAFIVVEG